MYKQWKSLSRRYGGVGVGEGGKELTRKDGKVMAKAEQQRQGNVGKSGREESKKVD